MKCVGNPRNPLDCSSHLSQTIPEIGRKLDFICVCIRDYFNFFYIGFFFSVLFCVPFISFLNPLSVFYVSRKPSETNPIRLASMATCIASWRTDLTGWWDLKGPSPPYLASVNFSPVPKSIQPWPRSLILHKGRSLSRRQMFNDEQNV